MGKLDDLCAIKIMGWTLEPEYFKGCNSQGTFEKWLPAWRKPGKELEFTDRVEYWNPCTSLDDALVCLERAASMGVWNASKYASGEYHVAAGNGKEVVHAKAKPLTLAICLCSLRAMGVPESEISLAMED